MILRRLRHVEQPGLRRKRAIAADPIDRAVTRGRRQPSARIRGQAISRPALGSKREGVLRGFVGEVEVAEEADQGRENPTPLLLEDPLEDG